MSDRVCVDEGYNPCFRLGLEAAQNMVGVVAYLDKKNRPSNKLS